MLTNNRSLSRGFSLIELLVVVAIIGALAAIGTVAYNGYVGGAKASAAKNSIQQISLMQQEYQSLYGSYHTQGAAGSCTPPSAAKTSDIRFTDNVYNVVEEYEVEETYDVEETFTTTESVPGSAAVTSTVTATATATREVN